MRTFAVLCSALVLFVLLSPLSAQNSHPLASSPSSVLTYHNNNQRTGLNSTESTLTPANVNSNNFGKVNFLPTSNRVRVEPLYVSGLTIQNGVHNVVYVEDDNDNVYAFDADQGNLLWQASALGALETPAPFSGTCPEAGNPGIIGTPVIDLKAGSNGAIYFVAASYGGMFPSYHHRLHALDLTTGAELFGGPTEIRASYPGNGDNSFNGNVIFDPAKYFVRAALLESQGSIYFGFTSLCDQLPYTGWLLQYSASTLQQLSVLNLTPNGDSGSIWQSGGGIAADSDGYLYILDANGTFDTLLNVKGFPLFGDFGNSFLKVSGGAAPMSVADYFAMYNTVEESDADADLGSGGAMVIDIPSGRGISQANLVVGAGKDGHIYVANRNNMGKWNPLNNNNIYQDMENGLPTGNFSTPAFFNNTVYYGALYAPVSAFPVTLGFLQPPSSQTNDTFTFPGATPSISSNSSTNGILWAVENNESGIDSSILHAYDALDLSNELYNSNQNPSRDQLGLGNHFVTPMIANGKVYIATRTGVAVFGLLGHTPRATQLR